MQKPFKDSVLEIVADMTSEDSAKAAITQFVNKYGTLDILVCNVGAVSLQALSEKMLMIGKSLFQKIYYQQLILYRLLLIIFLVVKA